MNEMSEMNNFNAEEDRAIAAQLDGEEVVQEIKADFGAGFPNQMKSNFQNVNPLDGAVMAPSYEGNSFTQKQWYKTRRAGV